jgi:hypothetical protein
LNLGLIELYIYVYDSNIIGVVGDALERNFVRHLEGYIRAKCHTEHKDSLYGQNADRTSQEAHCVSATEPNRLMLFRESVAV